MSAPIPELLRGIVPEPGQGWHWEPLKPYASEGCIVVAVNWNGEEVWIESESTKDGRHAWNDLARWMEAAVLVSLAEERAPASVVTPATKPENE